MASLDHRARANIVRLQTLLLAVLLHMMPLLAGCGEDPVIGEIDDTATLAIIRYEAQGDGIEGVVYRQLENFDSFIGASKLPVLVAFYAPKSKLNTMIIPQMEQMADDYKGRLEIVWVDAEAEPELAERFSVETVPQFTVVVGAAPQRSLIGYDDEGAAKLEELIKPYLG